MANPLLRAAKRPKLDNDYEDVEPGLLKRIGQVGASGLSKLGNALDLIDSMPRDVLAGRNPFDQLLTPFSDVNRTTGRELNRMAGLAGPTDTYGNFFGGIATEIALAPSTYATFGLGALTKAGKAAQAAGTLTKGLRPSIAAGERSLLKASIPFTDAAVNIGTGPLAQKAAGYLDTATDIAKQTAPVRYARGLFDPSVMGKFDYADQQVAEAAHAVKQAGLREARLKTAEYMDNLKSVHKTFKESFGDTLSQGVEGNADRHVQSIFDRIVRMTGETGDVDKAVKEIAPGIDPAPSLKDSVKQLASEMKEVNKTVHASIEDKGGLTGWVANHVPRYVSESVFGKQKKIQGNRLLPTMHAGMQARTDEIRDVPAEIVNKLLKDEAARGENAATHIASKYSDYLNPKYGEVFDEAGAVKTPGSAESHAAALAEWAAGHKKQELFDRLTPQDFLKYQTGAQVTDRSLDAIHNIVKQNLGDEGVSLASAYRKAWANPEKATAYLSKLTGMPVDELAKKKIPKDVADAIVGVLDTYQKPAWMERVGQVIDKANQIFKQNVTLPFPSFWTRNLTSGQYLNMATGLVKGPKDMGQYLGAFQQAFNAYRSGDSKLLTEMFVEGVIDNRMLSEGVESLGGLGWEMNTVGNPLHVGESLSFASQQVGARPSGISALDTARTGYGAVLRTGEKASAVVEFMNRVPLYLYLKEKGWAPAQAAAKVRQLQIDYSDLSPFERDAMKRLVPFYSWQRKIAPVIAQTLLERPGGAMAQTIRATREASDADASTPPHVASTLAVPNPFKTPEPGGDSYLTGFGLPFEQLAQYAEGPRAAGREVLSQLTPYVKAPLEFATNQSFFQTGPGGVGRPIDDLDPTIGRTLANLTGREKPVRTPSILEFAAGNSPAARLLTAGRQLSDPRKTAVDKALNLLTGVRQTDVSPAAKDRALMDQAAQVMKGLGAREFSETYLSADRLNELPAPQRALANKLNELKHLIAARRRERQMSQ